MKEVLQSYICQQLGKVPAHINEVLDCFREVSVKRNTILLEVGEVCRECYFVVEGCLKVTTVNLNGDESTTSLVFEQEWRTAMQSFVNQQPSNERILSVEPCQLLAISRHNFVQLSEAIPTFEHLYKRILETSYTNSIERVQTLMNMRAIERVQWLLSKHPLIFTRLSNRLIASYLGVSEATLSRLKAKL